MGLLKGRSQGEMFMEAKKAIKKMGLIGNDFDLKRLGHPRDKRVLISAKIDVVAVILCLCNVSKSKALFGIPTFAWQNIKNVAGVFVSQLLYLHSRSVLNQFPVKRANLDLGLKL